MTDLRTQIVSYVDDIVPPIDIDRLVDELFAEVFLTSADGTTWTAWAADPDVFSRFGINDAVALDDVLIAGGAGGTGPALWVYSP